MPDNASAPATGAAAGATPTQTTPVSPAAESDTSTTSATDGTDALGDPGKRALEAMKAERDAAVRAAKAAEKARDDAIAATATDAEKALKAAKAEGAAEVREKLTSRIRRSEVKVALAAAGINPTVLDLAINASEFSSLNVNDDGEIEGLKEAITTFKNAKPDLFKPLAVAGSADGGIRGPAPSGKLDMNELIRGAARG